MLIIAPTFVAAENKDAVLALDGLQVNAVTDITGYGLLGHLKEICQASNVTANVFFQNLKFFPGVEDLAKKGFIPKGTRRNLEYIKNYLEFDSHLAEKDLLIASDAQTSGGLLISLPKKDAELFINIFGSNAFRIGEIIEKEHSMIFLN